MKKFDLNKIYCIDLKSIIDNYSTEEDDFLLDEYDFLSNFHELYDILFKSEEQDEDFNSSQDTKENVLQVLFHKDFKMFYEKFKIVKIRNYNESFRYHELDVDFLTDKGTRNFSVRNYEIKEYNEVVQLEFAF